MVEERRSRVKNRDRERHSRVVFSISISFSVCNIIGIWDTNFLHHFRWEQSFYMRTRERGRSKSIKKRSIYLISLYFIICVRERERLEWEERKTERERLGEGKRVRCGIITMKGDGSEVRKKGDKAASVTWQSHFFPFLSFLFSLFLFSIVVFLSQTGGFFLGLRLGAWFDWLIGDDNFGFIIFYMNISTKFVFCTCFWFTCLKQSWLVVTVLGVYFLWRWSLSQQ